MSGGPVTESVTRTGTPPQEGIPVENPATGQTIATVPALGVGEIRSIVAQAREAQPIWAAVGFEGRAEVLLAARRWMAAKAERVVSTIVSETGRPADETQFAELSYGLAALEFWAKMAPRYLADEEIESASPFVRGRKLVVRYAPLGVVGVIGPWNYPLNNSFGDCIPALAAGNAVVLKPSPQTPLTSLLMAEMLTECEIPEGVFQVATGGGGGGIISPPQIELIESHVRDAVAKGARVVTGGKRAAGTAGRFFEPTVLADVDHTMLCMTEETFGPTLP